MPPIALILLAALAAHRPAAAAPPDNETCLTCHADRTLTVELPSGERQSLFVDVEKFGRSVHGGRLGCIDCHAEMSEVPHPAREFKSRRDFSLAYYEQCKRCHFDEYTRTLDSAHYRPLARGDRAAPTCVDCHGAHETTPAREPRTRISQTCARCHAGVVSVYASSVHGKALTDEANPDVPVCTDCHRSHAVVGPRAPGWRLASPAICANCHSNAPLMKKYGLSPDVQKTYLADFHGVTASLQRSQGGTPSSFTALCIDCHGVHDIAKVRDPNSRVIKANLVKTCRNCHPGASENFPAAWLSHYDPTWQKAPLVYAVRMTYLVMIPFMIGGLLLQMLLHLWRVVVNR